MSGVTIPVAGTAEFDEMIQWARTASEAELDAWCAKIERGIRAGFIQLSAADALEKAIRVRMEQIRRGKR